MMTHLLTEDDCDKLRDAFHAEAEASVGTAEHAVWIVAAEMLGQARTQSFIRRARQANPETSPPAATPSKAPALAGAADDEL